MAVITSNYLMNDYRSRHSVIHQICRQVMPTIQDAEDCAQDFYFYAERYCVGRNENIKNRRSFLKTACRRFAVRYRETLLKEKELALDSDFPIKDSNISHSDSDPRAVYVMHAMENLTEKDRIVIEVFRTHFIQRDCAAALQCTEEAFRKRLSRAVQRLRARVERLVSQDS